MPAKLVSSAWEWSEAIDGPFPRRMITNCAAVNKLFIESQANRQQLLADVVQAFEQVAGAVDKRRRLRLEKLLVPAITTATSRAWRLGYSAEQEHRKHKKTGKLYASRDTAIVEAVSKAMKSPAKPGLEKACRKLANSKTADGNPLFTVRDEGKKPMTWRAIKGVWLRSKKPHPK